MAYIERLQRIETAALALVDDIDLRELTGYLGQVSHVHLSILKAALEANR